MNRLLIIGINTVRSFASPVFNFLIAILGIKYFGKEAWGSLIDVMLWIFFIVFIMGWGNREYMIRKYSKVPSKIYHAFYSNLFSRSMLLPFALLLFIFFPKDVAVFAVIMVFFIHCYNAMDSLVVYHQKFAVHLLGETLGFSIIAYAIFSSNVFDLVSFLQWYCIAFAVKIICLFLALQLFSKKLSFTISFNEFKAGAAFFLLGFSGWLTSKIDIYIVDLYLPKSKLTEYQLLITAFLMLQALAGYLIVPFTKHVYRLSSDTILKIQRKLYVAALPLVMLGSIAIYIVMEYFVQLNLHYSYYVIGGLTAIPPFFYTLDIMKLMRQHKELKIVYLNSVFITINLVLILILITKYEVLGVLVSVCITQWIILGIYKFVNKEKFISSD